jgi:hypothetical protein
VRAVSWLDALRDRCHVSVCLLWRGREREERERREERREKRVESREKREERREERSFNAINEERYIIVFSFRLRCC